MSLFFQELEFWEVPEELISECCWKTYQLSKACRGTIDHIDESMTEAYPELLSRDRSQYPLATRIWLSLEKPDHTLLAKVSNPYQKSMNRENCL
jgi:hypothetical protein